MAALCLGLPWVSGLGLVGIMASQVNGSDVIRVENGRALRALRLCLLDKKDGVQIRPSVSLKKLFFHV